MKRLHIGKHFYWYNKDNRNLYFDKGGLYPVPNGLFNFWEYQSFLKQKPLSHQ